MDNPYLHMKQWICSQPQPCAGIIYCQKKETCEDVALWLQKDGIKAAAYHAGKKLKFLLCDNIKSLTS
jgi:superfamily II DNA helicase RecQ